MIITNKYNKLKTNYWFGGQIECLCIIDYFHFEREIFFSNAPKHSLEIKNAGGSSEFSEGLSMQYMHDMFNVTEFVPEKEVDYWIEYKMCDYLMIKDTVNYGVSVTRAVNYPFNIQFTFDDAIKLLNKKMYGLIIARNAVNKRHQFTKSILHIWCYNKLAAKNILMAYEKITHNDKTHTYETIYVICSVSNDMRIYNNRYKK